MGRGRARRSTGWNIRHSLWLLVPLGSFGFLGGAALLVVGSRAKRPLWWVLGLAHLVLSGVALALTDGTPVQEEISTWILLGAWIAGSSFAVSINPEYLQLKWDRLHAGARAGGITGTSARAGTGIRTNTLRKDASPASGGRRGTIAGQAPQVPAPLVTPPQVPAPAPRDEAAGILAAPSAGFPAAGPKPRAGAVDVNTATAAELEALPGFTPGLAREAVRLRTERGGFASPQDFAAALNLPPHRYQRLRDSIVCVRRPGAPPSFGRVVDY